MSVDRDQKETERQGELKQKLEDMRLEHNKSDKDVNVHVKKIDHNIDDERLRKEFSQFDTITSAKVRLKSWWSKIYKRMNKVQ